MEPHRSRKNVTWFPPYGVLYIPALSSIHDTHSVSNVDWSVRKVKMLPSSKKYIITLIPSTRSVFDVWNRDIFCDVKPQGVFSVYSLTNILVLIFLAFLRESSHNKSTFFLALICTNYPRTLSCNSSAMRRNTVFCNKEIFEFFLNVIFIELRSLIFDIQTHR